MDSAVDGARAATDCDSVSDDGLQGFWGNLQQAADPPGFSLTEDTSHFKRLTLKPKTQLMCDVCV